MSANNPPHRKDIDGLRAMAVLLVVAFHLNLPLCHGGYVGVDVFFVISGFLITQVIEREIQESRFSIAAFYERRIRRILPALCAMVSVSTAFALYYLLPGELISYAKSMISATMCYSNIHFWSAADYFDAPARTQPLLHTWSLGVEEQFYFILPFVLVHLSRRWARYRIHALTFLFALSLCYSSWAAFRSPESAFYLLTSRAWELLTGSLVALAPIPIFRSRWLREGMTAVGVFMVLIASYKFRALTPFPGVSALLPCIGASMIIAPGRGGSSAVSAALSLPPLRFIGIISYSAYLWHWPIIVFAGMGLLPFLSSNTTINSIELAALSLAAGALSWKFIEQPFRVGKLRELPRKTLFATAAGVMAGFVSIAILLLAGHGLEGRFPSRAVDIAAQSDTPSEMRIGTCFITSRFHFERSYRPDLCLRLDASKANYLLLGDSHSAMLWPALHEQLHGANVIQASVAGCNPVLGISSRNDCGRMMNYIFGNFLPSHNIQGVFVAARWQSREDLRAVYPTIEWFTEHQIPVYVFGPVVEYDASLPRLLAYSIAFGRPDFAQRHMHREYFELDAQMKHTAESEWGVHYISLVNAACSRGACREYADPAEHFALMGDDNHLSLAGSQFVVRKLLEGGQLPAVNGAL